MYSMKKYFQKTVWIQPSRTLQVDRLAPMTPPASSFHKKTKFHSSQTLICLSLMDACDYCSCLHLSLQLERLVVGYDHVRVGLELKKTKNNPLDRHVILETIDWYHTVQNNFDLNNLSSIIVFSCQLYVAWTIEKALKLLL